MPRPAPFTGNTLMFANYRFFRRIVKTIQRPEVRFPFILALTLLGMVFAFAFVFSIYENNISFGDGLWTAYITLTTIGYGDIFAKTWEGRTVTILTSLFGIGCFGVFTGIIVEKAMQRRFRKMKGEGKFSGEDHLVIVNVPSYEEIKELINELDDDKMIFSRKFSSTSRRRLPLRRP